MKRKTAYLGLFAAVAIIFGYVESLIPVFTGIPGIKLGLANLAVLFILNRYSFKEAALVSVVRILVIGFMFGNLFSILYSLAGAALSLTVMDLLKKHSCFSLISISVAGGVTHNIGQLIVAMIVVSNTSLMVYAPALLVAGVLAGILIGVLTKEVVGRLPLVLISSTACNNCVPGKAIRLLFHHGTEGSESPEDTAPPVAHRTLRKYSDRKLPYRFLYKAPARSVPDTM